MIYYINPPDCTKEEFLEEHGIEAPPDWSLVDENYVLVCLVYNANFTAAGICVDEREFLGLKKPDGRAKTWYLVPKEVVRDYL